MKAMEKKSALNEIDQYADSFLGSLTEDQISMIKMVVKKFPSIPQGMTSYQIKMFVFNEEEFPTPYAVYYQAVLEIWVRVQTIMNSIMEIKMTNQRGKIKNAEAQSLLSKAKFSLFDRSANRERAELVKLEAQSELMKVPFSTIDLETKIKELNVFLEIADMARGKLELVPEYGDWSEEEKKWILKRVFNSRISSSSLIGGKMELDKVLQSIAMGEVGPKLKETLNKNLKA